MVLPRWLLSAPLVFSLGCAVDVAPQPILATDVLAAGAECPNGGFRVRSGVDEDGNDILDEQEAPASAPAVCFPPPAEMVIDSEVLSAGGDCPNGGERVHVGVDTDDDGTLAAGEIRSSTDVCFPDAPDPAQNFIGAATGDVVLTVRRGASSGEPNTFATLEAALEHVRARRLLGRVIIEITAGAPYEFTDAVILDVLDGIRVEIRGSSADASQTVLRFPGDAFFLNAGYRIGAIRNLTVETTGDDGSSFGLELRQGSSVTLDNVTFNNFTFGMEARGGSVAGTRVDVTCTGVGFRTGVWANENGRIDLSDSMVTNCNFGFYASNGSTVRADGGVARNCNFGFRAENGSFLQANGSRAEDSGFDGFSVVNNSSMLAEQWGNSNGPGGGNVRSDVSVRDGSTLRVVDSGASMCGTVTCDVDSQVRGCGEPTCNAPIE
ncbi:MAG: right-handed parallel beta-helix repeat-containing protein [Myxococcota bacterium]